MFGIPDPRMLLAGGAALVLVGAGGYVKGRWDGVSIMKAEYAIAEAEAIQRAADQAQRADQITLDIQMQAASALAEIVVVKQIITREVPRYVTREADARYPVSVGFVELHDAAATGRVPAIPDPASGVDAPAGIALSVVAGTVTDNYGNCRDTIARLTYLQDWVREQALNQ